jgi:hypothetical protein
VSTRGVDAGRRGSTLRRGGGALHSPDVADDARAEAGSAPPRPSRWRRQRQAIGEDLIQAELDTPPREETSEQIKRSLHMRALRIAGGIALLIIAAAVTPVPGPGGIVFLLAGLGLLAEDVPFARRLLDNIKARTQDESGGTSKWVWILGGCGLVASACFSYWFYVLR